MYRGSVLFLRRIVFFVPIALQKPRTSQEPTSETLIFSLSLHNPGATRVRRCSCRTACSGSSAISWRGNVSSVEQKAGECCSAGEGRDGHESGRSGGSSNVSFGCAPRVFVTRPRRAARSRGAPPLSGSCSRASGWSSRPDGAGGIRRELGRVGAGSAGART